jgi:SsrA-binding protein
MNKQQKSVSPGNIAVNRKARFDYFIEERFEAGLVLQGWEVKSLRAGRLQLNDSYVILKNGEAWLLNAHISPLITVSTHIEPNPTRTRKLLLNHRELSKLFAASQKQGYTLIPLSLYWKNNHVKVEVGIAKGKKEYDKRETEKQRDWERERKRILKR